VAKFSKLQSLGKVQEGIAVIFSDTRTFLSHRIGQVDGSSHATTSSIRSAVSIELRLVTDTDRQTQTQDDSIDGGEKRHWEAWTGLRDQTPRPVGHSQVAGCFLAGSMAQAYSALRRPKGQLPTARMLPGKRNRSLFRKTSAVATKC